MPKAKTNNIRFSSIFRSAPLEWRFLMSYQEEPDGCWKWIGATSAFRTGHYGIIHNNKKALLAHRVSWEIHYENPGNSCVLHKCDNRRCVNPNHLFLGDRVANNKDRDTKGRKASGTNHGKYIHGLYVNKQRWRTRTDGSKYFYSGNSEREG